MNLVCESPSLTNPAYALGFILGEIGTRIDGAELVRAIKESSKLTHLARKILETM